MMESIKAELAENGRLRLGLALLVVIAWVNVIVMLKARVESTQKALTASETALARASRDAATTDWPLRAERAIGARNMAYDTLWKQPTLGLAQARFQEWVSAELVRAGLTVRSVAPATTLASGQGISDQDDTSELWRVRIRFDAEFDAERFNNFLLALARSQPKVIVESLNARGDPNPRLEGVLVAYFLKPIDSAGASK